MKIQLYDYQQEAVDEIESEFMLGSNKVILSACTSYGKTFTSLFYAIENTMGRVFISLSISALVDQFIESINKLEFEDYGVVKRGYEHLYNPQARIQIIMDNSFVNKLTDFGRDCELLIIDEIHVRITGDRMKQIIGWLQPEYILGMSGTPYDSRGFIITGFTTIETITLKELTDRGKLTPIRYFTTKFATEEDLSCYTISGDDYSQESLSNLYSSDEYMRKMVDAYKNIGDKIDLNPYNCKSIWLCSTIEACNKLEAKLQDNGFEIYAYHGKLSDTESKQLMHSFRTGEPLPPQARNLLNYNTREENRYVNGLISVQKLAVGFDVPDIDIGVACSTTKVRSKIMQYYGRLCRKSPKKETAYFLDFGQNIMLHGFADEDYKPLPPDADVEEIKENKRKHSLEYLDIVFDGSIGLLEINRESYELKLKEMKQEGKSLSELTIEELKNKFAIEEDYLELIIMMFAFVNKVYGYDGKNDTRNYKSKSWDKENNREKEKVNYNFYNESKVDWVSETWIKLFDKYDDKYLHRKWTKALKTRIRSVVNSQKSIYSIRFFAEKLEEWYLEEQDKEIEVVYEPSELEKQLEQQSQDVFEYEIEIDESIPF